MNVAIIPAKAHSSRIPNKNWRPFHGKPMVQRSIETARASGLFDEVWVSCEYWELGGMAMGWGAKFYPRPLQYTGDSYGTQEVAGECLRELSRLESWRPEFACVIYACAPMLTGDDLKRGFADMMRAGEYAYVDGWYYWGMAEWFMRGRPLVRYEHQDKPAGRWIDIDTLDDWKRAEEMYAALSEVNPPHEEKNDSGEIQLKPDHGAATSAGSNFRVSK